MSFMFFMVKNVFLFIYNFALFVPFVVKMIFLFEFLKCEFSSA